MTSVDPVRRVMERYVQAAHSASATAHDAGPPAAPGTGPLARAGIPQVDQDESARVVSADADRRSRLGGLVVGAGWSWPDS